MSMGFHVTLATLCDSVQPNEMRVFSGPRFDLLVGHYRPRHRARDRFRSERDAIRQALDSARPDVATAHWSYEYALGAIDSGVPTLVTVHDVPRVVTRLQPTPYRLMRWWMHRETMARASLVVFNSPYTRDQVNHHRWRAADVVPNALPSASWTAGLKAASGPDSVSPVFVSVNNGFGRLKNVRTLVESFALVKAALPGATLRLVGSGYERGGPAEAWATRASLSAGLQFMGPLEYSTVLRVVEDADIMIHPSLEESFGMTLVEAISVGTPVIGGERSGAVPWVLHEGRAGLLVDVRSPKSIAGAMMRLSQDGDLWRSLRSTAHALCKERFSMDRVALKYVRLLEGLLV